MAIAAAMRRIASVGTRVIEICAGPIRPWLIGLGFVWAAGIAVAFARDPSGVGGMIFFVSAAVLILIISFGPILLGARPRRIWALETLAGITLLLSLLGQSLMWRIGPLTYVDLTYFAAYILLLLWLLLLSRHVGGGGDRTSVLDSAGAAVGLSLALWSTALAPIADGSTLPSSVVYLVYPTVDVALLALATHLAMRLGRLHPAMMWLLASFLLQLTIDTAHSVVRIVSPDTNTAPIFAAFIFWLYGLAVAATDPSVVELSRQPSDTRHGHGSLRTAALLMLGVSPAILTVAVPVSGMNDRMVRTVLVALLLTLLMVRLWRTMAALSRAEADSHHRATHDELTGLLNRAALAGRLDQLLAANAVAGRATAVLFFDCDDFKYVNDTWGHQAGDTLLRDIAIRLPACLGPHDTLARQGGDEFVVLATVDGLPEAVMLADRVEAFFDEPLQILPGRVHAVTTSMGLVVTPPGAEGTTQEILGRADLAMYEAKAGGRARYVVFDQHLEQGSRTRSAVGDRLEEAVHDGVIGLELQPIMGGEGYTSVVGWEALARWNDPDLGAVPPDVFVPLAEQLGLIADLGEAVLRRACLDLARLHRLSGEDDLAIFVNVSPAQLWRTDFGAVVRDALSSAGLPGRCLRLELTETLLVDKGSAALGTLEELRALGVAICLDDFGTGYASLATLLRLPIDCVKLDKSLTARLGEDPAAPRQVRAVIDLIVSLGIDLVIAEGVETEEQEQLLHEVGCPMTQGWLYGRPSSFEAVLAARTAPVRPS
ncbi:putative bifunctional diguanylate cyclase/phosphodiesterase [Mobilicoccus caccae]|uniref:Diguanylate cyclase (GGDEF)-like protein n=1 Tax=Mobilicoccus caccae TaxID=1859295 RepID=A0ABQ6IPK1_9MICO|nr:EAL domain-containing protein [Mobilicoccus caccae]GMA39137.1 hypothetical protein GCM10025883_11820 [Mobilicoccus caccae]